MIDVDTIARIIDNGCFTNGRLLAHDAKRRRIALAKAQRIMDAIMLPSHATVVAQPFPSRPYCELLERMKDRLRGYIHEFPENEQEQILTLAAEGAIELCREHLPAAPVGVDIEKAAKAMCVADGLEWEDQKNYMTSGSGTDDTLNYLLHAQACAAAWGLIPKPAQPKED